MSQAPPPAAPNLGFLTVVQEANGFAGGYLVTNGWGRPVEFRLSTAVQPNRVHQILYGPTLRSYVCAELIGKTLVEKAAVPVQLVLTDTESVLDLRQALDVPVARLLPAGGAAGLSAAGLVECPARSPLVCHPRFPADVAAVRALVERLDAALDLGEPFSRIREAMAEARKMGVTNRAA